MHSFPFAPTAGSLAAAPFPWATPAPGPAAGVPSSASMFPAAPFPVNATTGTWGGSLSPEELAAAAAQYSASTPAGFQFSRTSPLYGEEPLSPGGAPLRPFPAAAPRQLELLTPPSLGATPAAAPTALAPSPLTALAGLTQAAMPPSSPAEPPPAAAPPARAADGDEGDDPADLSDMLPRQREALLSITSLATEEMHRMHARHVEDLARRAADAAARQAAISALDPEAQGVLARAQHAADAANAALRARYPLP